MQRVRVFKSAACAGFLAATALAVALPGYAGFKPSTSKLQVESIAITATPITSFKRGGGNETHFGKLDFHGGLVLAAPENDNFGGWSGLVIDAAGRDFISVSDAGSWMTGTIDYAKGAPSGITNARIGPLLGTDGKPLKRRRDRDAEAMALVSGSVHSGTVLVSFEGNHRITQYGLSSDGLQAAQGNMERPKGAAAMHRNQGFEAMTVIKGGPRKGSIVALSERLYDSADNHTGWIQSDGGWDTFHVTNIGDFDLTDIASLEDGTLFLLERRFRWLEGVKMRIRRFAPDAFQPDKAAEGEVLIEADLETEIDNMEGLALSRGAGGETILTLISDDNFNHFLQRTVLLQFSLKDTAK